MRDRLALALIRLARRVTRWGFVDDHLAKAEQLQLMEMVWN